jgi:small subunit ribosomal protein S15
MKLVGRRRKILKYLRNKDPESYKNVIQKLGLRK